MEPINEYLSTKVKKVGDFMNQDFPDDINQDILVPENHIYGGNSIKLLVRMVL